MEFYHRGGRLEPLYRRRWQIIVAMIYFHA
jgi:hypothetical protein